MIDPELFASLRVIWGRHAESQTASIQRDLCSPAGQGTYAKAFYFLLSRYREDTLRSRSDDVDSQNMSIGSESELESSSLSFTQDWNSQPPRGSRYVSNDRASTRTASVPASRSPSVEMSNVATTQDDANPSRANRPAPGSAAGVRAPSTARLTVDSRKPGSGSTPNVPMASRNSAASAMSRARKSYHPQSLPRPDHMRNPGTAISPLARPHRSASESAEIRPTVLECYPARYPFRPPSPIYTARLASGSAMDVDLKSNNYRDNLDSPENEIDRAGSSAAVGRSPVQSMMEAVDALSRDVHTVQARIRDGVSANVDRQRHSATVDKENVPLNDGWTHVEGREAGVERVLTGRDIGNRDSLIPVAVLKTKKERERKSRR